MNDGREAMEEAGPGGRAQRRWLARTTTGQARDTGLALVLLCLVWAYLGHHIQMVLPAIVLLLLSSLLPRTFAPLAVPWFAFSRILGEIVSRIILTLVFFLLVTPVGLVRRWAGKDPMQLRRWKRDDGSVLVIRGGVIGPEDLEDPY
jgi:hypothetical protein